jgi:hypothetical protein
MNRGGLLGKYLAAQVVPYAEKTGEILAAERRRGDLT